MPNRAGSGGTDSLCGCAGSEIYGAMEKDNERSVSPATAESVREAIVMSPGFSRGSRIQTAVTDYGEAIIVTVASVLVEVRGKPLVTFCR